MFFRMVGGALFRQWKKMILIAVTIALGASLATAMLSVMFDIGDKINSELKTYGANITVKPKTSTVVSDLYEVEGGETQTSYLAEDELSKVKTIFWANNIVDFAPFLDVSASLDDGADVTLVGSWFNHHLSLSTGEELDAGIKELRTWWDVTDGEWIDESKEENENLCMVGSVLAQEKNLKVGDEVKLTGAGGEETLTVAGIYDAGGDEDNEIYTTLGNAQTVGGLAGKIGSIEVSALTNPDDELSERAAKDPNSLTVSQYETWYCTAYVSSICYQLQEAISDSVASAVRQVANSEGQILDKTQLLMAMITILSMIGSALGICNLVTASVMDRSQEIGLMKAVGAQNSQITGLVLTEIFITSIVGGFVGFLGGLGFAQIIGHSVFSSAISLRPIVIPLVILLVFLVTLIGSLPAIRMLLKLSPSEVLHGK